MPSLERALLFLTSFLLHLNIDLFYSPEDLEQSNTLQLLPWNQYTRLHMIFWVNWREKDGQSVPNSK